ncbi:hypothetical protein [Mycobacterium sp. OTB74]|uniref:hypothetical protein n=1 Tax=Mycobacterium sp. OTB74 TaxID=1853452 RepID=UPI0024744E7D|nr:hypothetical protein [Mycobacterium sp. OTB74]MDH6246999.1 hypothetical protein [Mycobacterium sp. OTB74]
MSHQHSEDDDTTDVLSDNQIRALTAAQRRALIRRLQRPIDDVVPTGYASTLRRAHLGLMIGGAVFMTPWIVYLAFTLPRTHMVRNWSLMWVGFDCLLVVFMAVTAVLAWLHRYLLVFAAFTTGILLLCDAWFDVMTASAGELRTTVVTAVLGGLLAAVLMAGAASLVRVNAGRLWQLEPGESLWHLPLMYP